MRAFKTILVTGGAGFIGSNFIRYAFAKTDFAGKIVNLDALTYAGNLENIADIAAPGSSTAARYVFEQADICDRGAVEAIFAEHEPDAVVHFAAETHVDRSILSPDAFIRTNVLGTFTLPDVARNAWKGRQNVLFHHVSTDEVYVSLGETDRFTEETPFNMLEGKPLPVYGDGKHIRDWLYVEGHNSAVWTVVRSSRIGEKRNIGGENEWENINSAHLFRYIVWASRPWFQLSQYA